MIWFWNGGGEGRRGKKTGNGTDDDNSPIFDRIVNNCVRLLLERRRCRVDWQRAHTETFWYDNKDAFITWVILYEIRRSKGPKFSSQSPVSLSALSPPAALHRRPSTAASSRLRYRRRVFGLMNVPVVCQLLWIFND